MTTERRAAAQESDAASVSHVWRLRRAAEKLVECSVRQTVSKLYTVTVVIGSEACLDEIYPDSVSAMRRAIDIRERLLKSGGWTAVMNATES